MWPKLEASRFDMRRPVMRMPRAVTSEIGGEDRGDRVFPDAFDVEGVTGAGVDEQCAGPSGAVPVDATLSLFGRVKVGAAFHALGRHDLRRRVAGSDVAGFEVGGVVECWVADGGAGDA